MWGSSAIVVYATRNTCVGWRPVCPRQARTNSCVAACKLLKLALAESTFRPRRHVARQSAAALQVVDQWVACSGADDLQVVCLLPDLAGLPPQSMLAGHQPIVGFPTFAVARDRLPRTTIDLKRLSTVQVMREHATAYPGIASCCKHVAPGAPAQAAL